MDTKRDDFIDFLRFIGLACIIFAHVKPPHFLLQLRNFDVSLMVIVSAMAFSLSYKQDMSYGAYVWSRIKRLVFPTWIFLTTFLGALYFLKPEYIDNLTLSGVIGSFAFIEGFGYVWIIRVFLLVSLVSPFIYKWHMTTKSDLCYLGTVLLVYLAYEAARYATLPYVDNETWPWPSLIFYYLIPYACLFAFGLRMQVFTLTKNLITLACAFSIFVALGVYLYYQKGYVAPTWHYEFPPSAYYISYSLIGCVFFWIAGNRIWFFLGKNTAVRSVILFIAQNSLWVYLWHIPFAELIELHFLIEYTMVSLGAVTVTALQIFIVKRMLPHISNARTKRSIKTLFTG